MSEEENQAIEEEEIEDEKMNLVFPTATIVREMKRHVDSGKMIKKEVRFQEALNIAIQEYADLFCEGNFNLAVRQLIKKGLTCD